MHQEHHEEDQEFSFKNLFVPLTTFKAIHIIVIVGFIVYGNMLFNGFVWDDKAFVLPAASSSGLNIFSFFGQNVFNSLGQYRPIDALYFSILYSIFGSQTFFYHLSQLLFHIVNAILLYFLFKSFIDKYIALLCSLIFLIHPMQVESVSYIATSVGSPLSFFFGISALLFGIRTKITKKLSILIVILLSLCLFSKESGILFIFILLIYRYLFNKGQMLLYIIISLLAICTYAIIRFSNVGFGLLHASFVPIAELPLSLRLLNIPAIGSYYITTFFFPRNLSIMQHWVIGNVSLENFYLPLIGLLSLIIVLIAIGIDLFHKKQKIKQYLFFCIWFTIGFCFYLQIFPLDQTVSDRWFYFTIAGLVGLIGIAAQSFIIRNQKFKILTYAFFITCILLLSWRTLIRNFDWHDPITLYKHDSQVSDSYLIELWLGTELMWENKLDEAQIHFNKSFIMRPYDTPLSQIGFIYERKKNYVKAKEYYIKAMKARSFLPAPYKHDGTTYINISRYSVFFDNPFIARQYIQDGLKEYPKSALLWIFLALAEYKLGHNNEAVIAAQYAYKLAPNQNTEYLYQSIRGNGKINIPIESFY